jgi:hypothetical protein
MKKLHVVLAAASLLLTALFIQSCGLTSGTVFISQEVSGGIEAVSPGAQASHGGGPLPLDEQYGGAKVDLRDNADWQDIDIDGIEDICVRLTIINRRAEQISGEAWITVGEDSTFTNIDSVQAHGGFRIFTGMLVGPLDTLTYPCSETYELFENLDRLVDAVRTGVFWVWGRGDQDVYNIRYEAIYLGIHVTGSI